MKIALFGHGKMGKRIVEHAEAQGHSVIAAFSRSSSYSPLLLKECDVCIDFSHADVVLSHVEWASTFGKPIVIGTTGWEDKKEHVQTLITQAGTAAIYSPNFSLGMALFVSLLEFAAPLFSSFSEYDAAGVEFHHQEKKDAPSGTAKVISDIFGGTLPFSSVRCGQIPGTHTVIFDSAIDSITLTHEARSREGFALGALRAARWVIGKKGWWTLHDMVRSLYTSYHSV